MVSSPRTPALSAIVATAGWTLFVVSGWLVVGLALGGELTRVSDLWELVGYAVSFAAFAGGIAAADRAKGGRVVPWPTTGAFVVLGVAAYLVFAYAVPIYDFRLLSEGPGDPRFPYGPETPAALQALLDSVTVAPPDAGPAAGSVFRDTPAWVRYRLTRAPLIGVFLPVNALFGWMVAFATAHLRTGTRRRLRWALGVVGAAAFIAVDVIAVGQVRGSPGGSGWFWAWGSLYPSVIGILLVSIVRARQRDR